MRNQIFRSREPFPGGLTKPRARLDEARTKPYVRWQAMV